jgi:3-deoxy-manno-octulosonate cytidylyltransferase (CMP-KDO synthetase)
MIEHVYRRAADARLISRVIVATDDERIAAAVQRFGGDAVMTRASHRSGTDRLAEVALSVDAGVFVNVQGDEPLLDPGMIDAAVRPFADAAVTMTTLCRRIADATELANPNVVKVVRDRAGRALYFSRAAIPFRRPGQPAADAMAHIGLYGYRRATLLQLAGLAPTALEQSEALEQLRALEHGIPITVIETAGTTIGVDTPEDLARVRALMAQTLTP